MAEPIQQVRVSIKVENGVSYDAETLSEVSLSRTIAGHDLAKAPVTELISFVGDTANSVLEQVSRELAAQAVLASTKLGAEEVADAEYVEGTFPSDR